MSLRTSFFAPLFCALLLLPSAGIGDENELERLRGAVLRGEALPLSTLQSLLLARFPGEVVNTELDEEDEGFIYEFEVLQVDGRLLEVEMNAATGAIIDVSD